ncbi:MAG: nickel pincer cofactor biosynthesis protein LarC [Syntrophales bacterium]|nr:nickel pincer cofactor biosynthesis protein LarC [Syntrophales bacterium]
MNYGGASILYFDCFSGISGDMAVAALLDMGIDIEDFKKQLKGLNLLDFDIEIKKTKRGGIRCSQFIVHVDEKKNQSRSLGEIKNIIETSNFDENVKGLSLRIFDNLAEAESSIHGVSLEDSHFHELGSVDSIVDIVSFSICFTMIKPSYVWSSPVNLGSGTVSCAHGILPVPSPAVIRLAKGAIPVYSSDLSCHELATPTGMAILKTVCHKYGPIPELFIERFGHGAGKGDYEIPNFLRVLYGKAKEVDNVIIIETNIDDMNPEFYGFIYDKLFQAGALDVYITPIYMKKQRPAQKLSVICHSKDEHEISRLLFVETSTLGLRKWACQRNLLDRKIVTVRTSGGEVAVKIAYDKGTPIKFSPEYEDCRRVALLTGRPLRDIYEEVIDLAKKISSKN